MPTTTPTPRTLNLLLLHGYTQSGPTFRLKTRALEKSLSKHFPPPQYTLNLVYPTGPINIKPAQHPGFDPTTNTVNGSQFGSTSGSVTADEETDNWGWWVRKGDAEPYIYEGMELGLAKVAEVLKSQGPFDGVIGFSQGAALAGLVASLLEPGRKEAFDALHASGKGKGMAFPSSFEEEGSGYVTEAIHPPVKFAVSYSGFSAAGAAIGNWEMYQAFYEPKIRTKMLHFIGQVDTLVSEERSLRLVESCAEGRGEGGKRLVVHPGGHSLTAAKVYVNVLADFIAEVMGWKDEEQGKKNKDEESLDDFPF
jgi:hypothetical protein